MQVVKTNISQKNYSPDLSNQEQLFDNLQKGLLTSQAKVEEYNTNIGNIHSAFQEKTIQGHRLIVRLFKKPVASVTMGALMSKIDKIPIIDGSGHKGEMINNPLPYKLKGVICAVSPDVLNFTGASTTGEGPYSKFIPGAVVEIDHVDLQTARYYPNEEYEDIPRSKDDVISGVTVYPNFEGYFSITPQNIKFVFNTEKVEITYSTPAQETKDKEVLTQALKEFNTPKEDGSAIEHN